MNLLLQKCGSLISKPQAIRLVKWSELMSSVHDTTEQNQKVQQVLLEKISDSLIDKQQYPVVSNWIHQFVVPGSRLSKPEGQKGCNDYIHGLKAKEYWTPEELSIDNNVLLKLMSECREELQVLQSDRTAAFHPYRNPNDTCPPGSDNDHLGAIATKQGHWNVAYIMTSEAAELPSESEFFTKTLSIAKDHLQDRFFGHILVSCLSPNSIIQPHHGPTNKKIRLYLPIRSESVESSSCYLEVNTIRRNVSINDPIIFDDSFSHHAVNSSSSPRHVLICDVWHPQLTDSEVSLLKMMQLLHEKHLLQSNNNPYLTMKNAKSVVVPDDQVWK